MGPSGTVVILEWANFGVCIGQIAGLGELAGGAAVQVVSQGMDGEGLATPAAVSEGVARYQGVEQVDITLLGNNTGRRPSRQRILLVVVEDAATLTGAVTSNGGIGQP
jgi:hypothetical protein